MERMDKNKDGKLTKDEAPEFLWERISRADANSNGEVSKEELEAHAKTHRPERTPRPEPRRDDSNPAEEKPAAPEAKSA